MPYAAWHWREKSCQPDMLGPGDRVPAEPERLGQARSLSRQGAHVGKGGGSCEVLAGSGAPEAGGPRGLLWSLLHGDRPTRHAAPLSAEGHMAFTEACSPGSITAHSPQTLVASSDLISEDKCVVRGLKFWGHQHATRGQGAPRGAMCIPGATRPHAGIHHKWGPQGAPHPRGGWVSGADALRGVSKGHRPEKGVPGG